MSTIGKYGLIDKLIEEKLDAGGTMVNMDGWPGINTRKNTEITVSFKFGYNH